jgi:acetoin utilization deacetylase AcuC-like enzyme
MLTLHGRVAQMEARSATDEEILRVHTEEHLGRLKAAVDRAMEEERVIPMGSDTLVSAASWDAAVGSAGAVLSAVEGMSKGSVRNAFVATRPPGHHATPDRAMGFCLLNHVAIGARHVQSRGIGARVLIVDWDIHHGNGTQDTFYEDPDVFYLSLHQSPHYPGTGQAEEVGAGAGRGATLNVPLSPGAAREEYRAQFFGSLSDAKDRFDPDFIFVSSGFDVLAGDPLGGQSLEPEDLFQFTAHLMEWARESCQGRLAVVLEGGYLPERLGEGSVAVLRALAGLAEPGEDEGQA